MSSNRVPSGVFSSIIAGATATQGSQNSSDLSAGCVAFLDTFKFPTFEVLVVLQVVLPVVYSFLIPCLVGFFVEICNRSSENEENASKLRRKTSSVLIETWAHWYFHWEMSSWIWMVLAIIYLIECPLNVRYYEFTVGMTIVSLTVSYLSNLLSDYRLALPKEGSSRPIFNVSCFILASWILRIFYPVCLDIYDLETEVQSDAEADAEAESQDPPSYTEALGVSSGINNAAGGPGGETEPPTYNETISRIRKQLPKLSRSISVSAQKLGRQMSVKRIPTNPASAAAAVENSPIEATLEANNQVQNRVGGSLKSCQESKKKSSSTPKLRQTKSLVEANNVV